jgi:hypothetical protein
LYQAALGALRCCRCLVNIPASVHNVRMIILPKRLAAACVIVFATLCCAALVGCGQETTDADPQQILDASSAKMKALAGFHFIYQLNQPESAKKAEGVQSVDADINDKGEMRATVEYLSSGSLINVDIVAMEDTHYVKFPLAAGWVQLKPSESPLENLNLAGLPVQILGEISAPTMVGIEKRAGQKTYHITGQVTKNDIENIAGNVSTADLFVTDLWIGISDSLLYEVDIMGPMTKNEPAGSYRSIILSNLDVAVDIVAPQ